LLRSPAGFPGASTTRAIRSFVRHPPCCTRDLSKAPRCAPSPIADVITCPSGFGGSANGTCLPCPPGTVGLNLLKNQSCVPCNTTQGFSNTTGASQCSPCPAGSSPFANGTACGARPLKRAQPQIRCRVLFCAGSIQFGHRPPPAWCGQCRAAMARACPLVSTFIFSTPPSSSSTRRHVGVLSHGFWRLDQQLFQRHVLAMPAGERGVELAEEPELRCVQRQSELLQQRDRRQRVQAVPHWHVRHEGRAWLR
jgi:hypothetical protein